MTKITSAVGFSRHFGIDSSALDAAGVLDPTLNVDTALFIDPLLLAHSEHPEICDSGRRSYEEHFATAIKLLRASQAVDDAAWRNARRLLSFPEINGTCLGYGAGSVSGSGSGPHSTATLAATAREIVNLGVSDPDLFAVLALFEDGFGPDRVSDMTTNVILGDLLAFNARVLPTLGVPLHVHIISLRNGRTYSANLPTNPFVRGGGPVILVPRDILRALPIVKDWSDISDAASHNADLRSQVNDDVAQMWRSRTLISKAAFREWALADKASFETFLEIVHAVDPKPYDLRADPRGELVWRRILEEIAGLEPTRIAAPTFRDVPGICAVVEQIIKQFRFLIEDRRLSEELYHNGKPRPEKAAQRLFFAVAYAYCKANDLDITPEAETGNGPVDFKFATGFAGRVLVEIKLSSNTKVVAGFAKQLERYKTAEEAFAAYYVVIDVGQMGGKHERLVEARNTALELVQRVSFIEVIDAFRRDSASKL